MLEEYLTESDSESEDSFYEEHHTNNLLNFESLVALYVAEQEYEHDSETDNESEDDWCATVHLPQGKPYKRKNTSIVSNILGKVKLFYRIITRRTGSKFYS